ncbi:MAG TPA: ChaN family lipoprotein [Pseudobdellovibrionaceae bacterium]|nr:ChaN family lipoprotein [Pseudobdellovibrionaceae bacterium]
MADRATWYRIRREMFEQLMAEVSVRWGREPAELKSYRKAYALETSRKWKVADRKDLIEAFRKHRIILMGDFHAIQQSQKTQLRLLELFRNEGAGAFSLAVECFPAKFQKEVDAYMAGALSEDKFLKKIGWAKNWGFPWEHYRPLFDWARRSRIKVLALNGPQSKMSERERFAAGVLKNRFDRDPSGKWVVLYGDLHLAENKLPAAFERRELPRPLRIFQNVEEVSFRLMKKGLDHQTDLVRYDRSAFAVLSVPPWVKWQNYLLWLDHTLDHELDEGAGDATDSVARMVDWLKKELRLDVSTSHLTVYTAGDPDLWSRVRNSASPHERKWIEMLIEDGRSFYLSKAGWGYLARPSVNHAASLAMQFIHDRITGGSSLGFRFPEDFMRMIWIEAVAYFGSKIINPKRKSDTLFDIRSSLSSRRGNDRGQEALRLALSQKMVEMMAASGAGRITPFRPKHKSSWIAAAHLLGALVGERLYHGYRKNLISVSTLQSVLKKPLKHDGFGLIYHELLEMIEALPAPFRSKKEKL